MSDFTPVELVKGDVEFTAMTPTQLCNALYSNGFRRKEVVDDDTTPIEPATPAELPAEPEPEPEADAESKAEPAQPARPATRRRRNTEGATA